MRRALGSATTTGQASTLHTAARMFRPPSEPPPPIRSTDSAHTKGHTTLVPLEGIWPIEAHVLRRMGHGRSKGKWTSGKGTGGGGVRKPKGRCRSVGVSLWGGSADKCLCTHESGPFAEGCTTGRDRAERGCAWRGGVGGVARPSRQKWRAAECSIRQQGARGREGGGRE